MAQLQTVPNQRIITVSKEPTDKQHLYTVNNLAAVDEAARYLQSKAGFKLYYYIAKNQNNRQFALSSKDFCYWGGVGIRAYNTAFAELVENGYLVPKEDSETIFMFYDKSRLDLPKKYGDKIDIEFPNNSDDTETFIF